MLCTLRVENFALIQRLTVDFSAGFNILTGETGAGKSILIDAVQIVLGGRASTDVIRTGCEAAYIEAVFETRGELDMLFTEWGWQPEEDQVVIVSRRITKQGKNQCTINGRSATLSMLRQIGELLLDIHGQHDHQSLLRSDMHRDLLDMFGGEKLLNLRNDVTVLYKRWRELSLQLKEGLGTERERAQRMDLLQYQQREISEAKLKPNEDEVLKDEWKRLAHAEKLGEAARHAYQVLQGSDRARTSVLDGLESVLNRLREIVKVDDQMEPVLSTVESALYQLQEASRDISAYEDSIEVDPQRLQVVHQRLELIERLRKKYGVTTEEILAYYQHISQELDQLLRSEEYSEALQRQVDAAWEQLQPSTEQLTALRKMAAECLTAALQNQLADLGMKQAQLEVSISKETVHAHGADHIEFMFSANPGETPKSLSKIISGGEMSRVMLALKTVLTDVDQIGTVIFDEIDTGVGGRAAQSVAEKMARIAVDRQVLCITHLPQIASMADRHFVIAKRVEGDRTFTDVVALDNRGQQEELARMLGGVNMTDITLQHAAEMIEIAQKQKKSWKN